MTDLSELAAALRRAVGDEQVVDDPEIMASYETDWTGRFHGRAGLVVRPSNTHELAAVVATSTSSGASVVPQGGNTGLVGGGVPRNGGVVISTQRMTGIQDAGPRTEALVSAGVTLAALQRHAMADGMEFGVDLAAKDSATLGGMVATNAGGVHVVRWGRMRAQVLGLEVVLHDGQVLDRLDAAPTSGSHDLVNMIVGSEGTLGIVSRARVRLIPRHRHRIVALLALDDIQSAVHAAALLRAGTPDLNAVEYFGSDAVDLLRAHRGFRLPYSSDTRAHLLVELTSDEDLALTLEATLGSIPGVRDSAVAMEPTGQRELWELREGITESINADGVPHKYDVWLPLSEIPHFEESMQAITRRWGGRLVLFGHLAEGSLHANVLGLDPEDHTLEDDIYRLVLGLGGSLSSEHGIGSAKIRWQRMALSPVELRVMKNVKRAVDPSGLLNPGVLVPAD